MRQPQENGKLKEKSLADINLKTGQKIEDMKGLQSRKEINYRKKKIENKNSIYFTSDK